MLNRDAIRKAAEAKEKPVVKFKVVKAESLAKYAGLKESEQKKATVLVKRVQNFQDRADIICNQEIYGAVLATLISCVYSSEKGKENEKMFSTEEIDFVNSADFPMDFALDVMKALNELKDENQDAEIAEAKKK